MSDRRGAGLGLILLTMVACGDIETTGSQSTSDPVFTAEGLTAGRDAAVTFDEERYGLGSSWYAYDATTHVLTPRPEVYLFKSGEKVTALEIVSYYNDHGESGFFSVRSREISPEPSPSKPLSLPENVKVKPTCARLTPLRLVDCDDEADVVFGTVLRALPAAGFAVSDPAIFLTSHSTDFDPVVVAKVSADHIDDIHEWPENPNILRSAASDPASSRVGWVTHPGLDGRIDDLQLQYTPNLELVAWRLMSVEHTAASTALRFEVLCATGQAPDEIAFPQHATELEISTPSGEIGTLVSFCGESPGTIPAQSQALTGLWPPSTQFDLVIDAISPENVAIRLAPGHLHQNWTRGPGRGSRDHTEIDLAAITDALWR